jgi:glycosyltransferase involved in cell wall biosynthesis
MGTQIHEPSYSKLEARDLLQIPKNEYVITNVSAIEAIKGIDLIIKAVSLLKQKGLNVLFAHLGGLRGNTDEQQQYADSLKQLVMELDVEDNIIWLGRRNDISDMLSFADCYVHPSWTEGLPSALMEAAMAGLPLIATRAGGMPEIVKDQYSGRLIESGNYHQLVSILDEVLTIEHNYGEHAKAIVYQTFDQSRLAIELMQIYEL